MSREERQGKGVTGELVKDSLKPEKSDASTNNFEEHKRTPAIAMPSWNIVSTIHGPMNDVLTKVDVPRPSSETE